MLDPNKHGVFNKEGYMSEGKIKQITWLSMFVVNPLVNILYHTNALNINNDNQVICFILPSLI